MIVLKVASYVPDEAIPQLHKTLADQAKTGIILLPPDVAFVCVAPDERAQTPDEGA